MLLKVIRCKHNRESSCLLYGRLYDRWFLVSIGTSASNVNRERSLIANLQEQSRTQMTRQHRSRPRPDTPLARQRARQRRATSPRRKSLFGNLLFFHRHSVEDLKPRRHSLAGHLTLLQMSITPEERAQHVDEFMSLSPSAGLLSREFGPLHPCCRTHPHASQAIRCTRPSTSLMLI